MATVNIIRYGVGLHSLAEDFGEILRTIEFTYGTRHLALAGLEAAEINLAITKAMKVCRINDIDPSDHFRSLYIFDEKNHDTYCEWRMTRQGFALAIMNAPNTNESIARWQWELVNVMQ